MEVSRPSLTDVKTNVSLSLKVISSHLYEPVSCPLYPWVAGTNLRLQTKVHDKQKSPYLTELHFYFEPSCHLDGGQVILVKTMTQFLSWGGDYAVLRQGRGNARQIQFLGICLAVLPQEVWTSDTVSLDHTWSPPGPPSASPGPPALWASSHHTPAPIRCMLLRPQLSRRGKYLWAHGSLPLPLGALRGHIRPTCLAAPTGRLLLPLQLPSGHEEVQALPTSSSAPGAKASDSPDLTVLCSHFPSESPPSPAHGIFI